MNLDHNNPELEWFDQQQRKEAHRNITGWNSDPQNEPLDDGSEENNGE